MALYEKMPEKNKYNFSQFQGSCWHSVVRKVVRGHIVGKQGKQAFDGPNQMPLYSASIISFSFSAVFR